MGATYQPEVVLLDISMPGIDGYETCRLIRQQPWGHQARLIALTGYSEQEDKQRAYESGFEAHLSKTGPIEELLSLLETNVS
ncbi:hypothetical protein GCM10027299_49490 [Larkinella ripae]